MNVTGYATTDSCNVVPVWRTYPALSLELYRLPICEAEPATAPVVTVRRTANGTADVVIDYVFPAGSTGRSLTLRHAVNADHEGHTSGGPIIKTWSFDDPLVASNGPFTVSGVPLPADGRPDLVADAYATDETAGCDVHAVGYGSPEENDCKVKVGNPVSLVDGSVQIAEADPLPPILDRSLIRSYNSAHTIDGYFGRGYEPYGNIYTMRAGATTDQPLRLPGQEAVWHSPSGAEENYNIHRWYRSGWGRYTQTDPAAMSPTSGPVMSPDTSLYGYSYANPLRGTDPLGLRAGDAYPTADAAAKAAIREVCSLSRTIDREFGGYIYRLPNRQFTYTVPLHGLKHGMDNLGSPSEELPRGVRAVASYHTHGDKSELNPFIERNDEDVSNDDMVTAHRQGIRAYVGTPFGTIWRYDPLSGPHDDEMRHAPPDSGHLKRIDHCDCPYVPAHHEPWIY